MIILRQKEYSKFTEGFKGAMKGAGKGALYGAALVPGKIIAAKRGKYKVALGITGAGALIGAGIGGKIGWENAISKYKYDNDPVYRAKRDEEFEKIRVENFKNALSEDLCMAKEFNYNDWVKGSKKLQKETGKIIPTEVLRYIRFFETKWSKRIKEWYENLPKDCEIWNTSEFKEIFPMPVSFDMALSFAKDSGFEEEICLLTANNAGDDGWIVYNFDTKTYSWDLTSPKDPKTLKEFLTKNAKRLLNDGYFSKKNKEMIQEFLRNL